MFTLFLAACGDVVLFNEPPELRFTSHEPGAVVPSRSPTTFELAVSDDDDPISTLRYGVFDAAGQPVAGELTVDEVEGTVRFVTASLAVGEGTLRVEATDGVGEVGSAGLALTVVDNVAPAVSFSSPVNGARVLAGTPLAVALRVDDPDPPEGNSALTLAWSGAAAEATTAPTEVEGAGEVSFEITGLALASWSIGVVVTDAWGAVGQADVTFSVVTGDDDDDGYVDATLGGDDCDDGDPGVNPGADETCDGVDQDCNGSVDDAATDASTWYADDDDDGFGRDADTTAACAQPTGHSATAGDCDDSSAQVYPGAYEVCGNEVDDDCNGTTDVDSPDAFVPYIDDDRDGYGSGTDVVVCTLPEGYALVSGDCDDTNAAVHPGATEVCDPADTDEDCNGQADDDDALATGLSTFYADSDRDGYGDPAVTMDRCDETAGWVATADDCNDASARAYTGATETCEDGVDNDCDGGDANCELSGLIDLSRADYKLVGAGALSFAGNALAGLDDTDGDGLGEVAVGAWGYADSGVVHRVPGASLASGGLGAYATVVGEASGDAFGYALDDCGDLDGDGTGDLVVGALDAALGAGAAYLFLGNNTTTLATGADASTSGSADTDALGAAVACGGDTDGDAAGEILVSAPGAQGVYLFDADFTALAKLAGGTAGVGLSLDIAPDVDGDGLDDLLVGDPQSNQAYLVLGGGGPDVDLAAADATYDAEFSGDQAGRAVVGLHDVSGDGLGDFAVGAPESDSPSSAAGAAYVVYGSSAPTGVNLGVADVVLRGEDALDRAGYTLAGGRDTNGDGTPDLLVGAYYDDRGGVGAGAAYLVYGGALASGNLSGAGATLYGETSGDGASEGLALAPDLDGDGIGEVLVGAPAESSAGGAAGAVYVLIGGGL